MTTTPFLTTISDARQIITPLSTTIRFPEVVDALILKYGDAIDVFCHLVQSSSSSGELLSKIRDTRRDAEERMSLLKMYRRCVAPVLDTETTKKVKKVDTETLVNDYGHMFKPISKLHQQFARLPKEYKYALAALVGEYDTRGQSGYALTEAFFDWFEDQFDGRYKILGPRRAGPDIELSKIYPDFEGSFPCDFVVRRWTDDEVLAVGFARYDATRGGAQSDDRTGGNANKVDKLRAFDSNKPTRLKLIFLADGPGLLHKDTWEEACNLDGLWDDRVRVTTLKTAAMRISPDWLEG